jgi:hypothetical protein
MRILVLTILASLLAGTVRQSIKSVPQYVITDSIRVGPGKGDHYGLDVQTRRLYGAGRYILDIDTKTVVDSFADSTAGGGFAFAPSLGRGLTRHGLLFDLRTSRPLGRVPFIGFGTAYDPRSKRAFLFGPDSITAVDMTHGTVVTRVSIPEAKAYAVPDGRGRFFVSMEDSSAIAVVDAAMAKLVAKYALPPATHPVALAIDPVHRRLFVSCDSTLIVLDYDDGRRVASLATSARSYQSAFDPSTQLLFLANGKGKGLTIIHEDSPESYSVAQDIADARLASTRVIVDPMTHRVFVPHRFADSVLGFEVLSPAQPLRQR